MIINKGMPYRRYTDGLYLAKQKSSIMPDFIDHYGVIDIGNLLNHPQGNNMMPIVIHQTFPYVRIDWLVNTGRWTVLGKVDDNEIINAKKRILRALKNPKYNLFGNNCEHFARYVTTGFKKSSQLEAAAGAIALGALLYSIWDINRET